MHKRHLIMVLACSTRQKRNLCACLTGTRLHWSPTVKSSSANLAAWVASSRERCCTRQRYSSVVPYHQVRPKRPNKRCGNVAVLYEPSISFTTPAIEEIRCRNDHQLHATTKRALRIILGGSIWKRHSCC